jgi:hypothetical protein
LNLFAQKLKKDVIVYSQPVRCGTKVPKPRCKFLYHSSPLYFIFHRNAITLFQVQAKTEKDLFLYVKTELREMAADELVVFFDNLNHQIFDMVSSQDINEKRGGVLAISMANP